MAETRKVTTKTGQARFFCVGREETYENKGTGKQTASMILSGPALEHFTNEVEAFIADYFTPREIQAGINRPFKKTKDGEVFIKAKAYFKTKEGKQVRIPLSDIRGKPVEGEQPEIGNGSLIRLRVVLKKTKFQGKLYVGVDLKGIQLLKLVKYDAGGFDAVEDEDIDGGFSADEFSEPAKGGWTAANPDDNDLDDEIPF